MNIYASMIGMLFILSGTTLTGQGATQKKAGTLPAADPNATLSRQNKAVGNNPQEARNYFERGVFFQEMGQWAKAAEDFRKTIASAPDHRAGHVQLTVSLHASEQMNETVEAATKALALAPKNHHLYLIRADALLHSGRLTPALGDINRALHLRNDLPMAYYLKGHLYQAMGQEDNAAFFLNMACGLQAKLCDQESLKGERKTAFILRLEREPKPMFCGCGSMFSQELEYREDRVRRMLDQREAKQKRTLDVFEVFTDFRFEDRYLASGIDFMNEIVDDAGRDYKSVHYDHGNGLVAADVDGDGLIDLYFLSQIGPNQLYRNLGGGRFENITDRAGVALADRISVSAAMGDMDNDGDPDLMVTTVKMGNVFFENDGKGGFKDISRQAGLDYSGHSSGVTFFDYDNDGRLDIFLANVGTYTNAETGRGGYFIGLTDAFAGHLKPERHELSILYRNLGGLKFADVGKKLGLQDQSFSGDATFIDLNQDGFQDLYVLNMQGDDHFYENQGGKAFVDRTAATFPRTPWGTMSAKFFDFNNDARPDLYLTDMHSDMSQDVFPRKEKKKADMQWPDSFLEGGENNLFGNAFYIGKADGSFAEDSDAMGLENYWPWGLTVGDLNGDGFQDIFVASSMNYPFRYGVNSLFLNNRGKSFLDSEFILGIEPRRQLVKPWFTLDCSGKDVKHQHCKGRSGRLVVWGNYGSRSSAVFDYDGDGDLDIITNEFHSEPRVLTSNLNEKKKLNFLKIELEGTRSNRDGLGARVTVTCGDQRFTRFHDGKSGYLSQSALPLYFGLGEVGKIDSILVVWPSGTRQTVTEQIPRNGILRIRESTP